MASVHRDSKRWGLAGHATGEELLLELHETIRWLPRRAMNVRLLRGSKHIHSGVCWDICADARHESGLVAAVGIEPTTRGL